MRSDYYEKIFLSTIPNLALKGKTAVAKCYKTYAKNEDIFYENELTEYEINSFDLVMFRPDPPVDIDYINATYVFDFVKTKVINSPQAIRDFNEKLHSIYFSKYMTDTLVTSSLSDIEDFLIKKRQIVLKPLNRCFGSGVMYLYEGDPNTRTIINTLTNNETVSSYLSPFVS